jgi:hypothetical protein
MERPSAPASRAKSSFSMVGLLSAVGIDAGPGVGSRNEGEEQFQHERLHQPSGSTQLPLSAWNSHARSRISILLSRQPLGSRQAPVSAPASRAKNSFSMKASVSRWDRQRRRGRTGKATKEVGSACRSPVSHRGLCSRRCRRPRARQRTVSACQSPSAVGVYHRAFFGAENQAVEQLEHVVGLLWSAVGVHLSAIVGAEQVRENPEKHASLHWAWVQPSGSVPGPWSAPKSRAKSLSSIVSLRRRHARHADICLGLRRGP